MLCKYVKFSRLIAFVVLELLVPSMGISDTTSYSYDSAGRLISASFNTTVVNYVYDAAGNVIQRQVEAVLSTGSPNISIGLGALNFGPTTLDTSSDLPLNLNNVGTGPLNIGSISVSGEDAGDFSLAHDSCLSFSPVISAGAGCSIVVRFSPASVGPKTASVIVISNDADSNEVSISLTGSGLQSGSPALTPAPGGQIPATFVNGSIDISGQRLEGATIRSGAQLSGGTLAGEIENQGTIRDVRLDVGAVVSGGVLSGNITGSEGDPATIRGSFVRSGTMLQHVVVAADVILEPGSIVGEGVTFLSNENIPPGMRLDAALPKIRNKIGNIESTFDLVDLTSDIVVNGPSLLDKILSLEAFQATSGNGLLQLENGHLMVVLDDVLFDMAPLRVRQAALGLDPGVSITEDGEVSIVTPDGREVLNWPAVIGIEELNRLVEESDRVLEFDEDGKLNVQLAAGDAGSAFVFRASINSGRAASGATPGISFVDNSRLPNVPVVVFNYEEGGVLREQELHSIPQDWESLKTELINGAGLDSISLSLEGVVIMEINGEVHRGIMDYAIEVGDVVQQGASIGLIDDVNADGFGDFLIIFPNGNRQIMFYLPPITNE